MNNIKAHIRQTVQTDFTMEYAGKVMNGQDIINDVLINEATIQVVNTCKNN